MASRKSKKDRRRPKQKQGQPGSQRLKSRPGRGRTRGGMRLIEPPDGIKMSEVLSAFVEPYLDLADTLDALRILYMTAILAWNVSLLPEDKQQDAIDDIIDKVAPKDDEEARTVLRSLVNEFIVRKEMLFAEYNRFILDFRLVDTGDQYHLTVLSSPEGESP